MLEEGGRQGGGKGGIGEKEQKRTRKEKRKKTATAEQWSNGRDGIRIRTDGTTRTTSIERRARETERYKANRELKRNKEETEQTVSSPFGLNKMAQR